MKNYTIIEEAKKENRRISKLLLDCVKDENLSIKERNQYYTEYLKLSTDFLKLLK